MVVQGGSTKGPIPIANGQQGIGRRRQHRRHLVGRPTVGGGGGGGGGGGVLVLEPTSPIFDELATVAAPAAPAAPAATATTAATVVFLFHVQQQLMASVFFHVQHDICTSSTVVNGTQHTGGGGGGGLFFVVVVRDGAVTSTENVLVNWNELD